MTVKLAGEFSKDSHAKDGLKIYCRECMSIYQKNVPQIKHRKCNYRRKYGITVEEYDQMLIDQSGCCAICGSDTPQRKLSRNFAVDHNHVTGGVRGLLCERCNRGIGQFKDCSELLDAAASYLRKYQ